MEREDEEGDDGGGGGRQHIELEYREGDIQQEHEEEEQREEGEDYEDKESGFPKLKNEEEFWGELQSILDTQGGSHETIDETLRAYLQFTTTYKDPYLSDPDDVTRCSYRLLASPLFNLHADYIRYQIIYSLLQEDDPDTLHLIVSFLLCDGRHHDGTFQAMSDEGAFPRLLELIHIQGGPIGWDESQKREGTVQGTGDPRVHRLLMDLLYEMSRIQRLKIEDLVLVEDEFVQGLFNIIEGVSDDAGDPYHYPVIRVLLVLNEQFMVSAHDPTAGVSVSAPTNKVIKILSVYGNVYKTFGENIILLLNREGETSLQLLTLKLLYLIFTTPRTYEYFYTNDLRVLVDILIRNLLDLPEEAIALRHTYLRVLYPLLANTQLKHPPHYKTEDINRLLGILVHGVFENGEDAQERILHFGDVDETTQRLVTRCRNVAWLRDSSIGPDSVLSEPSQDSKGERSMPVRSDGVTSHPNEASHDKDRGGASEDTGRMTPLSSTPASPDEVAANSPTIFSILDPNKAAALGMHLQPALTSATSVLEVAAHTEKPGVMTPSRSASQKTPSTSVSASKNKTKPAPPMARRLRGRHIKETELQKRNHSGELREPGGRERAPTRPSIDIHVTGSTPNSSNASPITPQGEAPGASSGLLAPSSHPALLSDRQGTPSSSRSTSSSRLKPALPPPRRSSHAVAAPPPLPAVESTTPATLTIPPAPPSLRHKTSMPLILASHHASHRGKPPPLPSNASNGGRTTPTASVNDASSNNNTNDTNITSDHNRNHQKPAEKPEPPKKRRWRSRTSAANNIPSISTTPTSPAAKAPSSVRVSVSSSVAGLTPTSNEEQEGDQEQEEEEWG